MADGATTEDAAVFVCLQPSAALAAISLRYDPIGARNLLRHFKAALKRAGLPPIRFHDLRHTAGSLMLSEGAHLTDVAEVLGHSSPVITARIYAHSYDEGKRRAIAGTGGLLRRGGK